MTQYHYPEDFTPEAMAGMSTKQLIWEIQTQREVVKHSQALYQSNQAVLDALEAELARGERPAEAEDLARAAS